MDVYIKVLGWSSPEKTWSVCRWWPYWQSQVLAVDPRRWLSRTICFDNWVNICIMFLSSGLTGFGQMFFQCSPESDNRGNEQMISNLATQSCGRHLLRKTFSMYKLPTQSRTKKKEQQKKNIHPLSKKNLERGNNAKGILKSLMLIKTASFNIHVGFRGARSYGAARKSIM